MSDPNVQLALIIENRAALEKIKQTEDETDRVVSKWARAREIIEREINATLRNLSMLISVVRQAFNALGQTMDVWWSAMFAMVSSMISTLMAGALALSAGVITSPFAAPIFLAAVGLTAFQTGNLTAAFQDITARTQFIETTLAELTRSTLRGF